MVDFDWTDYEGKLVNCLVGAVEQAMDDFPDERFYAACLAEFYSETKSVISLPGLSINTEEEVLDSSDSRWSPPDWYWNQEEFTSKELRHLHRRLNKEANRLDDDHWCRVYEQFENALVRVSKKTTTRLKKRKQATKEFGFFLFDEESPKFIELLSRCMSAAKFQRVFPRLAAMRAKQLSEAEMPLAKRLKEYGKDVREHGDELVKIGRAAIPVVIKALDNPDRCWAAADVLGEICVPDENAIQALRKKVSLPAEVRFHEAWALALLGDYDFLVDLALANSKCRNATIRGLKMSFYWLPGHCLDRVRLDYRPLERLLRDKSCRKVVEKEVIGDWRSLRDRVLTLEDLDEAIRGTDSKYEILRRHAVECLGNTSNLKPAKERVMEAIVARFTDRSEFVRWSAVKSIANWKKSAKPHANAIRKLRRDPDPDVRRSSRFALAAIDPK